LANVIAGMIWCPRPDGLLCVFCDGLSTMIAGVQCVPSIEPAATTRASPLAVSPRAENATYTNPKKSVVIDGYALVRNDVGEVPWSNG